MITKISKGLQITIPRPIRRAFHLKIGSKIEIEKKGDKIVITPIEEDLDSLFKEAKKTKPKYKLDAKEMDIIIENEILG